MSIFRRLFSERRDLTSSNFDPNRIPTNGEGYWNPAGVSVNPDTALRLSTVYACVRLLSQTVASLPIDVYRKVGKARIEMPMPAWLERPNPDYNRFEFFEQVLTSLLLWGNAFVVKVAVGGELAEMWVVHPEWVRMEIVKGRRIYHVRRNGALVGTFSDEEVLHIRGFSMPGSACGLGPIDCARTSVALGLAAEEFGARFFGSGSIPSSVIEIPGDMSDPAIKRMALNWKAAHSGITKAQEPGFLTGGATFKPITIPNDAAQFIETRKLQVTEIARIFGVPPHMIGDLSQATFSNIEHQAIEFVVHGLRPWLVRLEAAFGPLLGRGAAPDRRTSAYVKFNVEALLRGDSASRGSFYAVMRNLGVLNADEIRALEELPPIPGGLGAIYWQPANIAPAGTVAAPTPAMPTPIPGNGNGNGTRSTDPEAERVARLLAAARGAP